MLDSIKATLIRMLGPESAQVVEFYVDEHLALRDPGAFEQALTDFLGSQAGRLLVEAIKSDLRSETAKSGMPESVSRFLGERTISRPIQDTANRPPESPSNKAPKPSGAHLDRFAHAAEFAMEKGLSFKDLVAEGLVASRGVTCGYATLACLGRNALDNPNAFAEKVALTFSEEGITMLSSLTAFCETKVKARQVAAL